MTPEMEAFEQRLAEMRAKLTYVTAEVQPPEESGDPAFSVRLCNGTGPFTFGELEDFDALAAEAGVENHVPQLYLEDYRSVHVWMMAYLERIIQEIRSGKSTKRARVAIS